jgi:hypothetical protein
MTIHVTSILDQTLELAKSAAESRQAAIVEQLNEFILRGLIVVEVKGGSLYKLPHSNTIEYRETVKLVLKDQEYIETLEAEIAQLKQFKEAVIQGRRSGKTVGV